MNEGYFPRCKVWAAAAWLAVAVLLGAAWVVMMLDESGWKVAVLLMGTACATSAVAATLHFRSYMIRVCTLIRAVSDFNAPPQRPVSSVR